MSYVEYRTAALYYATNTILAPLDEVQRRFLRNLRCTEVEALMEFNLAPLATRRDVAMLGVIHRTVLGKGPSHFRTFFKTAPQRQTTHWTRRATRTHPRQLEDFRSGAYSELLRRSALGLVAVYNLLLLKWS